jgi:hypothetical protein
MQGIVDAFHAHLSPAFSRGFWSFDTGSIFSFTSRHMMHITQFNVPQYDSNPMKASSFIYELSMQASK